jgi:hypothetical protein
MRIATTSKMSALLVGLALVLMLPLAEASPGGRGGSLDPSPRDQRRSFVEFVGFRDPTAHPSENGLSGGSPARGPRPVPVCKHCSTR